MFFSSASSAADLGGGAGAGSGAGAGGQLRGDQLRGGGGSGAGAGGDGVGDAVGSLLDDARRGEAVADPLIRDGVYMVNARGGVTVQVHEKHAVIQFSFQLRSTAGKHSGTNDRLEWIEHAALPQGAHLMRGIELAQVHRTSFEVPVDSHWKFLPFGSSERDLLKFTRRRPNASSD